MVTIMEALQNSKINLIDNKTSSLCGAIGRQQLNNAVVLLEKGYPIYADIGYLVEKYINIEDAPFYRDI